MSGLSIPNRKQIMTGRIFCSASRCSHDLAAEVYHVNEPQKLRLVMWPEEANCRHDFAHRGHRAAEPG